jgi:hypothetical protein
MPLTLSSTKSRAPAHKKGGGNVCLRWFKIKKGGGNVGLRWFKIKKGGGNVGLRWLKIKKGRGNVDLRSTNSMQQQEKLKRITDNKSTNYPSINIGIWYNYEIKLINYQSIYPFVSRAAHFHSSIHKYVNMYKHLCPHARISRNIKKDTASMKRIYIYINIYIYI